MEKKLSSEQEYAFKQFKRGHNIFLTGSGGSGKSELIRYFVDYLTEKKIKFQVTSTTGCSCVSLSDNINVNVKDKIIVKTINSWSGIKLCTGDSETLVNNIMKKKYIINQWRQIRVLIIDEISMMSCKMFTILEEIARKTRNSTAVFGELQIICVGDFFQLPPIPDKNDLEWNLFAFQSKKWASTIKIENHIELKTIFRQKETSFQNILNEIRKKDGMN